MSQANTLDGTLTIAINSYSGISTQKAKRALSPSNSFRTLRV